MALGRQIHSSRGVLAGVGVFHSADQACRGIEKLLGWARNHLLHVETSRWDDPKSQRNICLKASLMAILKYTPKISDSARKLIPGR